MAALVIQVAVLALLSVLVHLTLLLIIKRSHYCEQFKMEDSTIKIGSHTDVAPFKRTLDIIMLQHDLAGCQPSKITFPATLDVTFHDRGDHFAWHQSFATCAVCRRLSLRLLLRRQKTGVLGGSNASCREAQGGSTSDITQKAIRAAPW